MRLLSTDTQQKHPCCSRFASPLGSQRKKGGESRRTMYRVYQRFSMNLGKSIEMIIFVSLLTCVIVFVAARSIPESGLSRKPNQYSQV